MPLRRGYLLAEAVAALALAGVLAMAAAAALGGARRALRTGEIRDRAERAERETLAVLREALESGSLIALRGDTAADIDGLALASVICGLQERAVVLPPIAVSAGQALSVQMQALDVDDVVSILTTDGSADFWWTTTIDSVRQTNVLGVCSSAEGWTVFEDDLKPRIRLVLRDSLPAHIAVGMTVRVARPGRFTLYHAGSGDWMLGWRRCSAISGVCGVVQPVSGPLRPPSALGLQLKSKTDPARLELLVSAASSGRSVRATVFQ